MGEFLWTDDFKINLSGPHSVEVRWYLYISGGKDFSNFQHTNLRSVVGCTDSLLYLSPVPTRSRVHYWLGTNWRGMYAIHFPLRFFLAEFYRKHNSCSPKPFMIPGTCRTGHDYPRLLPVKTIFLTQEKKFKIDNSEQDLFNSKIYHWEQRPTRKLYIASQRISDCW